jgi:hypothetical protein
MIQAHYATKKLLKAAVGTKLKFNETSMFGPEYKADGEFCVADSSPKRKWFATVKMEGGLIAKVS